MSDETKKPAESEQTQQWSFDLQNYAALFLDVLGQKEEIFRFRLVPDNREEAERVVLGTAGLVRELRDKASRVLNLDPDTEFMKGLRLFFEPFDVQFSVIKSFTFGLTITGVGCFFGFHTTGGAEGVGRSTTRAVVVGSMVILVLDALWAVLLL